MADEYKDKFRARCSWVRSNNGIFQAVYEIDPGFEYLMINRRVAHGRPSDNKLYLFEIQPAFPHDTERKEN